MVFTEELIMVLEKQRGKMLKSGFQNLKESKEREEKQTKGGQLVTVFSKEC